ncbi:heterokaryon incompatibility protein HET-C [Coprinopsis cinerea okayama7|uniref:Heterokaryon incompatibility protein HET-C n=1 Tax=Coprinopsis cinerea (strain Okayama-7 / 130 / ATCC MYA-4618 / FGSC 9003) TaxID=240176 RepID=A8NC18_COPC7|nr:heterokaryon incompatibility protein HET-C [Coprinopsis cinerea okayama7\|eukprot:XP_001832362.1 heterokaryon incompatibility protein HET-C [Coprinopsis cinerea okayama7\
MSRSYSSSTYFLPALLFVLVFCLSRNGVYAFGAGNIPSFAYMEGRAFRHGDIEDVLDDLAKGAAGGFALASLIGKGRKFNALDKKRVYFGNWLRDYSQAIDIATLKKMPQQTIINLLMVLGFMAHGYATNEFEITEERLGCYLPVEHIDNPKGYGDGEDPRQYHPGLRPPIDPRELEIDPRTGMKNYIANEDGHWDTSKAYVRRILENCIHHGRLHRSRGQKQDEYEAFRLLGTALHTLEDYSAHSNFCELALVGMGYNEVFTHVGDNVRVQAPNGKWVAPIVTGTFGSDDFFHSLLGGASDSLSEASVSDLNRELDKARSKAQTQTRGPGGPPCDPADALRDLFFAIPGGGGSEMSRDLDNIQRIRAGPAAGGKNPDEMSPKELHATLWQVLLFRDSVMKKISKTIEKIPGLGSLLDKITDSISVFVFTTIEPFLKPILKTATEGLHTVSAEVVDKHDQYEVFNDPRASDPTHSFLSKDHFNLILNEPAGKLAQVIVINTVPLIIKAWDDASVNVNQTIEEVTQCLFHPDFHNPNSKVQREMLQCMRDWVEKLPNKHQIIQRLSKQSVRNHEHIRAAGDGGPPASQGSFAEGQAHQFQQTLQGYAQNIPGFSAAQSMFGSAHGYARDMPAHGHRHGHGGHSHGPPASGEAASYFGGGAPSAPPMPASPSTYGAPPVPPSPSTYGPPHSSFVEPNRPGYSPSYSSPPPSFPGGGAPSFPGAAPGFPSGPGGSPPPSFPGAAPGFPGAAPRFPDAGGYDGAPPFPGGPQGFPSADSYQSGYGQPPRFPGGPGGW